MQRPPTSAPAGAPRLPRSPQEIPEVFDWFAGMRQTAPVTRDVRMGMPAWHLFRYEDVATVLTDHARFSSQHVLVNASLLSDTLVSKDPPDHRKLRNLVNLAFTPRAVARLSGRVTQITQELLDAVRLQGKMDVVSDIAFPLPAKVIAELLGVPSEDWDIFQRWARVDSSDPAVSRQDAGRSMREEMFDYFSRLLE